jgi:hypothetical protein
VSDTAVLKEIADARKEIAVAGELNRQLMAVIDTMTDERCELRVQIRILEAQLLAQREQFLTPGCN